MTLLLPIIVGGAGFFCVDYALGWGWLGWTLGMLSWVLITGLCYPRAIRRWER